MKLIGKIGKKAVIKIVKSSMKSYWYNRKKGKRFTAILQKDSFFKTCTRNGKWLVWGIVKKTKGINSWVQIKDATIIRWL